MKPEGTDASLLGTVLQVLAWFALKREDIPKSKDVGLVGGRPLSELPGNWA